MKNIFYFTIVLALIGCKDVPKEEKTVSVISNTEPTQYQESLNKGKVLLETKCYVCHNPKATEDNHIAPPMVAIKARYLMGNPSKEEFGDAIWGFVEKPTMEKGKMKGALKKFGVMPYQPYNEEEIRLISDFIYEFKIEEPTWFKEHWEKSHGNGNYEQRGKAFNENPGQTPKTPKQLGLEIASATQKVLGKNLMGKMQNQGPMAALSFCNERAYPLTDSMSTIHNAKIKRVSDKARNPLNQASSLEMEHIAYFKEKVAKKEDYEPIVVHNGETTNFYYPIVTNDMCLKCHGELSKDISPEVASLLSEKYPEDKAVGYSGNEVRGIWSIVMENEGN